MFKNPHALPVASLAGVGGKARGLMRLRALGYAVPDFLILDPQVVNTWIGKLADEPQAIAAFLRSPEAMKLIADIVSELAMDWHASVAVRSSGVDEDGDQHSFAGIFETRLNVNGTAELAQAVRNVLLSAYDERALLYRLQRGLDLRQIRITVILQKMVTPLYSGVAFGSHPITGDRGTVWISLTEGLGEALVSGTVAGEEYSFTEASQVLRREGEHKGQVPAKFLGQVVAATRELSKCERRPQDVEWAWDGEKLWLLQTRPITARIREPQPSVIFDNSNIQESYCGVTTPLTFSYASTAYAKVYDQNLKFIGVSGRRLREASLRHESLLGFVTGRVYYNINQWYAALSEMPSFGRRKSEMEDMMGLEQPVDFVEDRQLSAGAKLRRLPGILYILSRLLWKFARLDSLVRDFDRWFWAIYRTVDLANLDSLNDRQLLGEIRRLQDEFLEKWSIPILNDLKVMITMGRVKRSLAKHQIESELKAAMYGNELESIKPTIELQRLAGLAASHTKIRDALVAFQGEELTQILKLIAPEFAIEVERYIGRYGDRCMGELKLETVTMRQDPELFYSLLRSYLQSELHLKTHLFASHSGDTLAQKLDGLPRLQRFLLRRKIRQLKTSVAHRELMRFHRSRNFGVMRSLYRALGQRWFESGHLQREEDIFYLTMQEIEAFGNGRSATRSLAALTSLRRLEFEKFREESLSPQVQVQFPLSGGIAQARSTPPAIATDAILEGMACSQGVVEGIVHFVDSPDNARDLNGKILLAERTDPGWTPLFALVKGVIIERGSMLSHSAVIAREMGIPAVLAIPGVTRLLQNGDYVRLDGNKGQIEILRRAFASRDSEVQIASI